MEENLVCVLHLMNGKLMFLQLCEGRIEELKVLTVNINKRGADSGWEFSSHCDLLRGPGYHLGSGAQCIFEIAVDRIIGFLFTLRQREQVEVQGFFVQRTRGACKRTGFKIGMGIRDSPRNGSPRLPTAGQSRPIWSYWDRRGSGPRIYYSARRSTLNDGVDIIIDHHAN